VEVRKEKLRLLLLRYKKNIGGTPQQLEKGEGEGPLTTEKRISRDLNKIEERMKYNRIL